MIKQRNIKKKLPRTGKETGLRKFFYIEGIKNGQKLIFYGHLLRFYEKYGIV